MLALRAALVVRDVVTTLRGVEPAERVVPVRAAVTVFREFALRARRELLPFARLIVGTPLRVERAGVLR